MNDSLQRGYQREATLPRENYLTEAYFSIEQLWSFSEQIYRIRLSKPKNIIEVGVGNGFVSNILKLSGLDVLTCDINPDLNPDIISSVEELPKNVRSGAYELISCCEVLEHMPFEKFEKSINIFASLSDNLFLTLPVSGRIIGIGGLFMKSWGRRWFSWWIHIPSKLYQMATMHYWEIGYEKKYQTRALVKILEMYYECVETNTFRLNPYHQYFMCKGSKVKSMNENVSINSTRG